MDIARALARTAPPPIRVGVVAAAPAGGSMLVNVDGAVGSYPVMTGTVYAVGETVMVARNGRSTGLVLGRLGVPAVAPVMPANMEPPAVGVTLRTSVISPVFTGTLRDNRWMDTSDLLVGRESVSVLTPTRHAVVDYGTQLVGLGAVLTQPYSGSLSFKRAPAVGGTFATQAVGLTSPADPPLGVSFDAASPPAWPVAAPGEAVTWEISTPHLTKLLDGTWRGWYLYGPAYPGHEILGLGADPESMKLTITYYA